MTHYILLSLGLLVLLGVAWFTRALKTFTHGIAANIGEGTHDMAITRKATLAITTRHLLVKFDTDPAYMVLSGASDNPLGTCPDAPAAGDPAAINLLGKGPTKKVVASAALDAGVLLYAAASGRVAGSGTVLVGMSLEAASGDGATIEMLDWAFIATPGIAASLYDANSILAAATDNTPAALVIAASRIVGRKASGGIAALTGAEVAAILGLSHTVFAAGIHDWAGGAAATGSISVTGLEPTDVVLCTLVARAASETLVLAVNDAANDQIDLTLSANGTNTTTKVSYLVLRPVA